MIVTALDDGVHHARHLGGDRGQRLAPRVGIVPVAGDVALELVAEAVLSQPGGDLARQPEGAPQPGVATLRQPALAAEGAGPLGREVEPAELQELAVVPEAPQVPGLGQDGARGDRPDTGDAAQELVVGTAREQRVGVALE